MENINKTNQSLKFLEFKNKAKNLLNPGIILIAVAALTLLIANSPWGHLYQAFWNVEIHLGTEYFNLFNHHGHSFTALQFVNDAIMAIFFFMVGVEIKREILIGELSSVRQAMLPIIAAMGGIIFPILIFYVTGSIQNFSAEEFRGIAIPMATDIAFSLGVLTMLGKRVPLSLKIFLLALAIVDDIGGIITIAAFYSEFTLISLLYIGIAVVLFGVLMIGNRMEIHSKPFYMTIGAIIWYMFLQAGIHPTIAGVLVAFTVPSRPHINLKEFIDSMQDNLKKLKEKHQQGSDTIVLTNEQMHILAEIENKSDKVVSPLQDFEDNLHNWVSYFIMPLFAFANAGVVFSGEEINIFEGVSLSIFLSLFLGKAIGIYLFTWGSVKLNISSLPKGMNFKNLAGVSMLGGIGFTVALFLASLSYPAGSELLNQAKMGILFGSFVSGLAGYFLLKKVLDKTI
jgi:NhaA family Na+:H+ antiporter